MHPEKSSSEHVVGFQARTYDIAKFFNFGWRVTSHLKELVNLRAGEKLLDVGCGTGTLLAQLAEDLPDGSSLCGIEPSLEMLEIAKVKLKQKRVPAKLVEANAENLPFPDNSFDWVVTSLVLHHLPHNLKERAASEAWRVLRPGGTFISADIGKADSWLKRLASFTQHEHAFAKENLDGTLDVLLQNSKFRDVHKEKTIYLPWSVIDFFSAKK